MGRLAETVVTTLELRRAVARVQRLAPTDVLTGLPNRAALIAALDRAVAQSQWHNETFGLLIGTGLDVESAAIRVQTEVQRVMRSHGRAVTASIGAITFNAAPRDVDQALAATDTLMYGAKAAGKNRVAHQHVMPVPRRDLSAPIGSAELEDA